jgi:CBS domain-containing protein
MATTHPALRTARDVMTVDLVCATTEMTLRDFARLLDEFEVSGAPVVDTTGQLIGVASKTDLIHRAIDPELGVEPRYVFDMLYPDEDEDNPPDDKGESMIEEPVYITEFMTEDPVTARPDESLSAIAARMIDARVHRIIIVDPENRPIGIVTSLDMLKVFRDMHP